MAGRRGTRIKTVGRHSVKVVESKHGKKCITSRDAEMDARVQEAVKAAVTRAKLCKKPIAKYDIKTQRAYLEYPDGVKKYVE